MHMAAAQREFVGAALLQELCNVTRVVMLMFHVPLHVVMWTVPESVRLWAEEIMNKGINFCSRRLLEAPTPDGCLCSWSSSY